MPQSRRTLLRGGLVLGSVSLTGCVGGQDAETPTATKTPTPTKTRETSLWLNEAPVSESEQDTIDPIVYSELSSGQQEIVQTALEGKGYRVEKGSEPPELAGLRRMIEKRAEDNKRVYLKRDDNYYQVGFASGGHIIVSTEYEKES